MIAHSQRMAWLCIIVIRKRRVSANKLFTIEAPGTRRIPHQEQLSKSLPSPSLQSSWPNPYPMRRKNLMDDLRKDHERKTLIRRKRKKNTEFQRQKIIIMDHRELLTYISIRLVFNTLFKKCLNIYWSLVLMCFWQINRAALDFDFEKVCSVCVSNINVYGCLVCGKYFQGRGPSSYAYAHSIHDDHHVFLNLETAKVSLSCPPVGLLLYVSIETQVYVLPDNYPVSDPSLSDIVSVLSPKFTPSDIEQLDKPSHLLRPSFDLNNNQYIPGFIGLNNIKRHDHINVIIHMLLHVPPVRNFLLLYSPSSKHSELVSRLSLLTRKLWSSRLFKSQISPHEFLQEVNRASKGKWRLEEQGDPAEFLSWLLNKVHVELGGTKKKNSSKFFSLWNILQYWNFLEALSIVHSKASYGWNLNRSR